MGTVAVIDFETTGMTPAMGDRATEVAVVILADGVIVDSFQSLMNTGAYIPAFIEELTGISNDMHH
jgi:DNA polymerase III subunit epsilon